MIVNNLEQLRAAADILNCDSELSVDTETTGLYERDRLFSLIIACEANTFYFNFQKYPDEGVNECLEWTDEVRSILQRTLGYEKKLYYLQNAKFDMHMLAKEGLEIRGAIFDDEVMGRVLKNNYIGHKPYSLKAAAARIGLKKDDTVEKYVDEHGLKTKVKVEGQSSI
jgi:DNA polymerase I-like protein with 3'-5' exonuclease and polymerase domains